MQRYETEGKKKDPSCQILIVLIMKGKEALGGTIFDT